MRFVYLLDQDPEIRTSVTWLLGNRPDMIVRSFSTGASFLSVIDTLDPGVLLLELEMPDMSGMVVLDALRARGDDRIVPVLLTGATTVPLVVRAMKTGAVDLVSKPYDETVLLAMVETAFARLATSRAAAVVENEARVKIEHLSGRERDVLRRLFEGQANKVIAHDLSISPRTVEIYRANMMKKLGVRSLAESVRVIFAARWELGDGDEQEWLEAGHLPAWQPESRADYGKSPLA
ncbi:MAG: LuxR C-terminal-related transcriptional regulator [Sphingomonas sp.]